MKPVPSKHSVIEFAVCDQSVEPADLMCVWFPSTIQPANHEILGRPAVDS